VHITETGRLPAFTQPPPAIPEASQRTPKRVALILPRPPHDLACAILGDCMFVQTKGSMNCPSRVAWKPPSAPRP